MNFNAKCTQRTNKEDVTRCILWKVQTKRLAFKPRGSSWLFKMRPPSSARRKWKHVRAEACERSELSRDARDLTLSHAVSRLALCLLAPFLCEKLSRWNASLTRSRKLKRIVTHRALSGGSLSSRLSHEQTSRITFYKKAHE